MEINWYILGIITLVVFFLIVFLVIKNQKDKKKYTKYLNRDYKRPEEENPEDTY